VAHVPSHCRDHSNRTRIKTESEISNTKFQGDNAMRFMIIVKGNKDTEAGAMPEEKS